MYFSSIMQIKNHRWIGNHAADHEAFEAVHRFVCDASHPLEDRAEALRIAQDKGMGMGRSADIDDVTLVKQYLYDVE